MSTTEIREPWWVTKIGSEFPRVAREWRERHAAVAANRPFSVEISTGAEVGDWRLAGRFTTERAARCFAQGIRQPGQVAFVAIGGKDVGWLSDDGWDTPTVKIA